jgi:hypothetical protein
MNIMREVNPTSNLTEIQKSQFLRLVDVFLLGPLVIYASTQVKGTLLPSLLLTSGSLIILNNAINYRKNL